MLKQASLATTAIIMATTAHAGVINTWSGAGPNACDGRCSIEWARSQLDDGQRMELDTAMANRPTSVATDVRHGDIFPFMAYYKDGAPYATRNATVAILDGPKTARGWILDGWAFVIIDECRNPAVRVRPGNTYGGQNMPITDYLPRQEGSYYKSNPPKEWVYERHGGDLKIWAGDYYIDPYNVQYRDSDANTGHTMSETPSEPGTAPVPVPVALPMAAAGFGLLALLRRFKRKV